MVCGESCGDFFCFGMKIRKIGKIFGEDDVVLERVFLEWNDNTGDFSCVGMKIREIGRVIGEDDVVLGRVIM